MEQPTNVMVLALLFLPLSAFRKRVRNLLASRYCGSVWYRLFSRARLFFLYSGRCWLFLCDARFFSRLFWRYFLKYAFLHTLHRDLSPLRPFDSLWNSVSAFVWLHPLQVFIILKKKLYLYLVIQHNPTLPMRIRNDLQRFLYISAYLHAIDV